MTTLAAAFAAAFEAKTGKTSSEANAAVLRAMHGAK
jgi:hypothetical protein